MRQYVRSLGQMTRDIATNLRRIAALARFEYIIGTKGFFLGSIWKLLSPLIQIGAYWLVFGIGLRSGRPVDGIPFVVWLTCGVTPWMWLNGNINRAASSIYTKAAMLTRSNIPTCLIPLSVVLAHTMDNGWNVLLLLIIYFANGCVPTAAALGLLYYVLCGLMFLSVCSLVTSALVMLARDFQKLLQAVMRLMFFLTPVFWQPGDSLPYFFQVFVFCNPFGYIVRGFRSCLLYDSVLPSDGMQTAVFWGIVVLLYLIGSSFQGKVRKNLLDYL